MKRLVLDQTVTTRCAGVYKTHIDVYDQETGKWLDELVYTHASTPIKHAAVQSMLEAVKSVRAEYGDSVEITFLTNTYEHERTIARKARIEHHFDACEDDGCAFCASLYEPAV